MLSFVHAETTRKGWPGFRTGHVWSRPYAPAVVTFLACGFLFLPVLAPQNAFDPAALDLLDSFLPPAWIDGGAPHFLLGTDDQGRDVLSLILFGCRTSLIVGMSAVLLASCVGAVLGLLSGYFGGWLDAIIMRLAEIQLTIPALFIAMALAGFGRAFAPHWMEGGLAIVIIAASIAAAEWPQFARLARSKTRLAVTQDYVAAVRLLGLSSLTILVRHVLPGVLPAMVVVAAIAVANAIIMEATLSYLGIGVPATQPSLGTLIRLGQDYVFSGEWWIALFPAAFLAVLIISLNLMADSLRGHIAHEPNGSGAMK